MLRQIKYGQRLELARPAVAVDEAYYLIELLAPTAPAEADADAALDGSSEGRGGQHPSMVPGPNSDSALASCAVRTLQRLAAVNSSSTTTTANNNTNDNDASSSMSRAGRAPFFFAVGLH